jgi:hypothetical protein
MRGDSTVIAWFLIVVFAAMTIMDCVFFFVIPIAFSGAITLYLAAAAISSPSNAVNSGTR